MFEKNETLYSYTFPQMRDESQEPVDVEITYEYNGEYVSLQNQTFVRYDETNKIVSFTYEGQRRMGFHYMNVVLIDDQGLRS